MTRVAISFLLGSSSLALPAAPEELSTAEFDAIRSALVACENEYDIREDAVRASNGRERYLEMKPEERLLYGRELRQQIAREGQSERRSAAVLSRVAGDSRAVAS